jgi:glycosidase
VQERAPGFWAQWAVELRRIRPDLLLLAEASARQPVWGEAGFSAAYDWTEGLGQWAWEGAFDKKRPVAPRIRRALEVTPRTNPFRFLENNDGRRRFITSYGPQLTRAAAAMLLTLPGIPCIYSGQEIGADYAPFKRTEPLDWTSDPNGLEALYASLANRRRATSARSDAALALLDATPSSAVLAYAVRDGRSSTLVAINFSGAALEAAIDVGEGSTWRTTIPPWGSVTSQPG